MAGTVQFNLVMRSILKNSFKKTCFTYRHSKRTQAWCSQSLTCARNLGTFSHQNVLKALKGLLRSSMKGTRHLGQITLASAFFVPMTHIKSLSMKEVKQVPIELPVEPKEIKRPKQEKDLLYILQILYHHLRLFIRGLRLFVTFAPILALYPITYCGELPTDIWWGLMLRAIEFSGTIMVKLGQWASTRRDIFSDSCCCQFASLQRRTQPHSWSFTKYRMRKAFGPNWRKLFVKFDNNRNPVGSGCVAQVYKVWMSKNDVLDQEILEEIISDLDDDNDNVFEGLEIRGFRSLLGIDDEDKAEEQAMNEWRLGREALRQKERENEINETVARESDENSVTKELDVSAVTETLASDIVSGEGFQTLSANGRENGEAVAETDREIPEHSLVEVWNEADLDKSLPVKEAPPDDLEDLIPVAVKILHPSVHSSFRRDLSILRACASFVTCIYPPLKWLSLPQCVDEFAEFMSGQINLKREAENLELFSDHFADVSYVKFPRPLRPYVTQKVLVETYEDGIAMGEFVGASGEDKPNDLKVRLAEIGVDILLKMIFSNNFVHGDMHPGNMLVQNININGNDATEKVTGDITRVMMVDVGCDTFVMDVQPDPNPLRVCLLDCGVVARLKEHDLINFKAVFKQVVMGDGESVASLFLENSEHQCEDPEAFKAEMNQIVETARQDTISLSQVDVGVLLQQVLGVLLRHQVRLESAFSSVVLAVFVLEGLGRTLDPDMDILERARPMIITQVD